MKPNSLFALLAPVKRFGFLSLLRLLWPSNTAKFAGSAKSVVRIPTDAEALYFAPMAFRTSSACWRVEAA